MSHRNLTLKVLPRQVGYVIHSERVNRSNTSSSPAFPEQSNSLTERLGLTHFESNGPKNPIPALFKLRNWTQDVPVGDAYSFVRFFAAKDRLDAPCFRFALARFYD